MKINIKPAGYLLAGVDHPDFVSKYRDVVQSYCARPEYANTVEPLHPESLVMELAEALQAMLDSAETEIDVNVDAYFKGRGLLDRVKNGSTS